MCESTTRSQVDRACVAAVALALVVRVVATNRGRTGVVPHPVPDQAAQGLSAALLAAGQPGAWLPGQSPPQRALPSGTHYGTIQYGIVDDGVPRASGTS